MTNKIDQATGVISIAIAGISVVLTPQDAKAWGDTLMQMAPLILIVILCWRIWILDKQFKECRKSHDYVSQQLLLAFTALQSSSVRRNLPDPEKIIHGQVVIDDILSHKTDSK